MMYCVLSLCLLQCCGLSHYFPQCCILSPLACCDVVCPQWISVVPQFVPCGVLQFCSLSPLFSCSSVVCSLWFSSFLQFAPCGLSWCGLSAVFLYCCCLSPVISCNSVFCSLQFCGFVHDFAIVLWFVPCGFLQSYISSPVFSCSILVCPLVCPVMQWHMHYSSLCFIIFGSQKVESAGKASMFSFCDTF